MDPDNLESASKDDPSEDGNKHFKIESCFYKDNFDPIAYFWQTFPPALNSFPPPSPAAADNPTGEGEGEGVDGSVEEVDEYLKTTIKRREQEFNIIAGQLSKKVMDHYDAFVSAMQNIQQLSEELRFSKEICREGRSCIASSKALLSESGLMVLFLNEQKDKYVALEKELENIKTIVTMKANLQQKIQEEDYIEALSLYTKCAALISASSRFNCVKAIDISSENTIIRKKLDESLAISCRSPFSSHLFNKTVTAYHSILKSSKIVLAISKHFNVIINNTVKDILYTQLKLERKDDNTSIRHIVKKISENDIFPVFRSIMKALVDIMIVHNQIKVWSKDAAKDVPFYADICSGIEQQRRVIWDEMQRTMSVICTPVKLTSFKIENFLILLDDLNSFIEIGEDYGGGESAHKLRGSIKQLSKSYYEDFHQQRVVALKSSLETENFVRFNPKSKIRLKDIKEISQFIVEKSFSIKHNSGTTGMAAGSSSMGSGRVHKFGEVLATGNPFKNNESENVVKSKKSQKIPSSSDLYEDENIEALSQEAVLEAADKSSPPVSPSEDDSDDGPIVTFSVVTLVKFIGEYTGIMKSLTNVSWDVCQGIIEQVQLYMFSIYTFFGPSLNTAGLRISANMKNTIQALQAKYLKVGDNKATFTKPPIKMSDKVLINNNNMYGLVCRSVCGESLLFLMDALVRIRPNLQKFLPKNGPQLSQFYQSSVETLTELRSLVYKELSHKLIPADTMVSKVQAVDWNTNDVPMTHSPYIDNISSALEGFKHRFQNLCKMSSPGIPKEIVKIVWSMMVSHIIDCLIEGYAAPSCSPQGRAMMGIDFRNLQDKLVNQLIPSSLLVPASTTPTSLSETSFLTAHNKRLEDYIKGYYLVDSEVEGWLKKHLNDYSLKQLKSLIEVGSWDIATKRLCLKMLQIPK